ncbi:uncharacterized protein BO87DRAFT_392817 [Aspergillus neoniger CBS 115656]|uniref:Uncharacterized protein n=1 Tax=Aspergillus neoniger (strain CBS 115656) TaxID=1448310 RepID=A0A318ZFX7_ASPNB|nr:hypothetical protein BO87DRAFT_392817 [Aspergillus neoniger CBS 115656]PYH39158.1 hypothetical protein BO87DRAFT_392817 [Aspergillus neoniger CBS 115656]
MKGGGSNFGIVTRFDHKPHPLIKIQYNINAQKVDPKTGLFANFNNGLDAVGMFYRDHTAEPPKAFEPFHNLKTLVAMVLPSTNGTLLFLQELYEDIHKTRLEVCKTHPSGAVLHNTIQSMGTAGVQIGKDRGEISWALKAHAEAAAKDDAEGVFQKLQKGGFLLCENV